MSTSIDSSEMLTGENSHHVLLPNERIINIQKVRVTEPEKAPSGLREIYRLARSKVSSELRTFNPPFASLALENEDDSEENLHLYEALFGRDSLRVAVDVLPLYPELAKVTILALAKHQGIELNKFREEEPGKIPHEVRDISDPIASKLTQEFGWQWPYYGSIDATPEYIRTVAKYHNEAPDGSNFFDQQFKHHRSGELMSIRDSFDSAVNWLVKRLDENPEGILEYKSSISKGLENQAWKDSWDAYFHKDGTMANHKKGIASIEVQRVAYDALIDAAELSLDPAKQQELTDRAAKLKSIILTQFWTDNDGGYFVLGTDRDEMGALRQLKIKTSNMGHLLHSRLLVGDDPELRQRRESIVRQIMSPPMRTNFGIRTLAKDEVRYRPGAYHNGSIWLWDTHIIARGLHNHGYNALADTLRAGLLNIINETKAFPEFIRGDSEDAPLMNTEIVDVWDETYHRTNRIEQPPQQIQAWSVGAVLALKFHNHTNRGSLDPVDDFEREILATL